MATDRVTLKIPRPLYNRIAEIIKPSGFSSVNDFVVFVLRDLVSRMDVDLEGELTGKELDSIRQRLKNLGYL
jgi:hypothetical protein